jgi:hypothetical protein
MSDKKVPFKSSKPKRQLRNYLLDKRFQLTYALIIVVIVSILTGLLGFLIFHQTAESSKLHEEQAKETIKIFETQSLQTINVFKSASRKTEMVFTSQSNETKKVFKEKTDGATGIIRLMAMEMEEKEPDLAKRLKEMAVTLTKDDVISIKKMSKRVDIDKKTLQKKMNSGIKTKEKQLKMAMNKMYGDMDKAGEIRKKNNRRILFGVVVFSIMFVIIVFLYSIVLTHKVAGPLFKISLYFKKIEDNNLSRIWPLRKGDQLQDFYHNFELAHGAVIEREMKTVEVLNEAIKQIDGNDEVVKVLQKLHDDKVTALGDHIEEPEEEKKS